MLVQVGCRFEYVAPERTPSLWQVRPRPDGEHRIVSVIWEPPAPARSYLDVYGNECDRLTLPAGRSVLRPPDLPMDFCSWFEAWLDGRWWTFDPRNNEPRVGRVVIARGRDALDGAMVTTWGGAVLELMDVWADLA